MIMICKSWRIILCRKKLQNIEANAMERTGKHKKKNEIRIRQKKAHQRRKPKKRLMKREYLIYVLTLSCLVLANSLQNLYTDCSVIYALFNNIIKTIRRPVEIIEQCIWTDIPYNIPLISKIFFLWQRLHSKMLWRTSVYILPYIYTQTCIRY